MSLNFGLAKRKYPHDIVEFNRERSQFVVRSQPSSTFNYTDYGKNYPGERRIRYDSLAMPIKSRNKLETMVIRGDKSYSKFDPKLGVIGGYY